MSVYKLLAGVVGLLLAAVVVTAAVGVATVFAAPAAVQESRPDNSPSSLGCAQEPWPTDANGGHSRLSGSSFVVRGRPEAPAGKTLPIFVINFRSRFVERSIGSGGTVICISYGLPRMGTRLLARP